MQSLLRGSLAASLAMVLALGISLVAFADTSIEPPQTEPLTSSLSRNRSPVSVSLMRATPTDQIGLLSRSDRAPAIPPGQAKEPPGQTKPKDSSTTTIAESTTSTSSTTTTINSSVGAPPTTSSSSSTPTTLAPSTTTTLVGSTGALSARVTVRGAYGRDSSASGVDAIKGVGFNTVLSGASRSSLDGFAALGLKAVVWLGEYDRTNPCNFEYSDSQVTDMVTGIAGHPAIAAYLLADEPTYAFARDCKTAPDQLRQRSDLVHSLDPTKPTMVTLTTWDGVEAYPYGYWAGTADIFGLVVYPCYQGTCNFDMINTAASEANAAGLGEYWAIIQDFSDSWYDFPTANQVNEQFLRWSRSNMTGYLVFAADGFACCTASDFETNAEKHAVLRGWNGS